MFSAAPESEKPLNDFPMSDAKMTSRYSSVNFLQLKNLFTDLKRPCGLDEIVQFNLLYNHLYPHLSHQEKLRAEAFVDELMEDLQDEELASKISGVL